MACGDRKAAFVVAILDPEVTVTQPATVTALTGIDALSHAIESYVTTRRNPVSQMFAAEAFSLIEPNLETVLSNPTDLEARGAMQMGAFLAGTAIENSMLGVCHACANPLTAHYGITHGLAIGILLPHVIRFNATVVANLYGELDQGLKRQRRNGNDDASKSLASLVIDLMRRAELPITLTECGVERGILSVLADEAAQQWTARFNPRPVTETEIREIYEAAQ
jgi:alcohol dehydrogenase